MKRAMNSAVIDRAANASGRRPPGLVAARGPRSARLSRLLVIDPERGAIAHRRMDDLLALLRPGDCLVVNDAGTWPASLRGVTDAGAEIEVRLASRVGAVARAIAFGSGDWRTPTEHRAPPPPLAPGARLRFGPRLEARVVAVASSRELELAFSITEAAAGSDLATELLRAGRPVQYSYLARDLELDEVQTGYASRPWAMEMPSAGRPLAFRLLLRARALGVSVVALTHAAGLSSTGDEALDARLPFAEVYEIPEATARVVAETRSAGGRVIAVGTTVVRALEDAARAGFRAGVQTTDLRIHRGFTPRIVDAVLSGLHEPGASHFELLEAFASRDVLVRAHAIAVAFRAEGDAAESRYLAHEFGDVCLILAGASLAR